MAREGADAHPVFTEALDGTPMMDGRPDGKQGGPKPLAIPAGCPVPPTWPPPPDWFDLIYVCDSDGKDSSALLRYALSVYPKERIVVVNNLLGDEHEGTIEHLQATCALLGLPLLFTWKDEQRKTHFGPEPPAQVPDLMLSLVRRNWTRLVREQRSESPWPGGVSPFCTGEGKAQPTDVLINNVRPENVLPGWSGPACRPASRVLILTGERREESVSRARKPEWAVRSAAPTIPRLVLWRRMILDWSECDVRRYLARLNVPLSEPYALGYSRHSCVFCIHKTQEEMVLSFYYEWERGADRVVLEEEMGRPYPKYRYGPYTGYRAIWEQVYGPWNGKPAQRPPVRPEALALVESMRQRAAVG